MGNLALEIGRALRRARRDRDLTLRQVSTASEGRFKPTSVAGYERGERSITLERFCDLCRLYGVPPQTLLAEIMSAVEADREPYIDLTALEAMGPAKSELVSGFVRQIRALRRERPPGTITLRAGDLEVLATAAGKKPDELLAALWPTARRED